MINTERLEKLLRNAPRPRVPTRLRDTLKADIILPRRGAERPPATPWLRRWLPILSFSAIFFGSLVAIAMQSSFLSELRRENATLKAATLGLEQLRQENLEYQK